MRIALVSCYLQWESDGAGSFAAFTTGLATLLKEARDDVRVIVACPENQPTAALSPWQQTLRASHIEVVALKIKPSEDLWPHNWVMRLSEQAAALLQDSDVVYFSDLANLAFHTVRVKRFSNARMPVCVTVLQGPSSWQRLRRRKPPRIPQDLEIDFIERYSAAHSDFVVATGQHLLDWAAAHDWQFRHQPRLLALLRGPTDGTATDPAATKESWLKFHSLACAQASVPRPSAVTPADATRPSVDLCIPYYNKPRHFPQLLESLERQTVQNFTVIAVDDGSSDPEARAVFQAMAEKYRPRGWTFFCQPNSWVDAARNQAAKRGTSEYLLMVDADDVPARNAIERMLQAARLSGDDCIVPATCLFAGDVLPYDIETGKLRAPVFSYYMPLGAALTAGLLEPEVFGGPMILIRRRAFEALGGYRELRGAAHEDWELHARLAFAGCKTDVLPEYLHFHRQLEDGLSRTADDFAARQRMMDCYEKHFASAKLPGAAAAMHSLYEHCRSLQKQNARGVRVREAEDSQISSALSDADYSGPRRFATAHEGPFLLRLLRRTYRRFLPLDARLRFRDSVMKLAGRSRSS